MASEHTPDRAFTARRPYGMGFEPTYGGALSFMRRRYTRDLAGRRRGGLGRPASTPRPPTGPARASGPQAIRRASAIFDGDPQYPFGFDPFETLAVIDYGDCSFDYGRPAEIPAAIDGAGRGDPRSRAPQLFSLGGDHFVTYPLLQGACRGARAARPRPVRRPPGHLAATPATRHRSRHVRRPRRARRSDRRRPLDPGRHPHARRRRTAASPCVDAASMSTSSASRGVVERDPARGRRGQGLSDLRHRLPRPGLRAGHRHAGRRRPVEPRGAGDPARRSGRSISSPWISSKCRRPMTSARSPRSPAPTLALDCSVPARAPQGIGSRGPRAPSAHWRAAGRRPTQADARFPSAQQAADILVMAQPDQHRQEQDDGRVWRVAMNQAATGATAEATKAAREE